MFKADNGKYIVNITPEGELVQKDVHEFTEEKYKPDNPFYLGVVPYILMFGCCGIDISFFYSLFSLITYDSPVLIILEVAGITFAADIVAAYAGILAKRIRQKLSNETLILGLLLGVPIFALLINGVLRFATMSLLNADGSVDAATVALTVICIATPVFTSVGNFAISYLCYDPLEIKLHREEAAIESITDLCRRIKAVITDYECDPDYKKRLDEMDRKKFFNQVGILINDANILGSEVRVNMMEYLGDPTSSNILSKAQSDKFSEAILDKFSTVFTYAEPAKQ